MGTTGAIQGAVETQAAPVDTTAEPATAANTPSAPDLAATDTVEAAASEPFTETAEAVSAAAPAEAVEAPAPEPVAEAESVSAAVEGVASEPVAAVQTAASAESAAQSSPVETTAGATEAAVSAPVEAVGTPTEAVSEAASAPTEAVSGATEIVEAPAAAAQAATETLVGSAEQMPVENASAQVDAIAANVEPASNVVETTVSASGPLEATGAAVQPVVAELPAQSGEPASALVESAPLGDVAQATTPTETLAADLESVVTALSQDLTTNTVAEPASLPVQELTELASSTVEPVADAFSTAVTAPVGAAADVVEAAVSPLETSAVTAPLEVVSAAAGSVETAIAEAAAEVVDVGAFPLQTIALADAPLEVVSAAAESVETAVAEVAATSAQMVFEVGLSAPAEMLNAATLAVGSAVVGPSSAAEPFAAPLSSRLLDGVVGAGDVVKQVGEPVTGAIPPPPEIVDDTVGAADGEGDGGGGLTDTVGSAVDTVGTAADTVADTASSTTDTVTKTAEETTRAAQETVGTAAESAKPVADAIVKAPSAEPVQAIGGTAVQPVAESVPPTDPTQPAPPETPAGELPAGEAPVGNAIIPDSGTVLPIPGPVADPATPVLPMEVAQDAIAQAEPATDVYVTPLAETPEATALPDGLTTVLQGLSSSEVQAVGVAGLLAAGAITIVRGGFSPTSSIMFTNIRLLPGFVNATIHRSGVTEIVGLPRVGGAAVAEIVPPRVVPAIGSITEPIRDGFERVRRGPVDYEDGDARLLMQVGVALGTLYVAFLTVWFWATRLRWNGGWRTGV